MRLRASWRLVLPACGLKLGLGLAVLLGTAQSTPASAQPTAQKTPQFGAALNQAMAGMAAAQNVMEVLLREPDIAHQAASDDVVRAALTALQAQATALQQVAEKMQRSASPGTTTQMEPPPDALAVCRANNAKLLNVGHDILHLYESQSFQSLLVGQYEPLLGLYRVELENIVQDNDDKLRDLQVFPDPKVSKP